MNIKKTKDYLELAMGGTVAGVKREDSHNLAYLKDFGLRSPDGDKRITRVIDFVMTHKVSNMEKLLTLDADTRTLEDATTTCHANIIVYDPKYQDEAPFFTEEGKEDFKNLLNSLEKVSQGVNVIYCIPVPHFLGEAGEDVSPVYEHEDPYEWALKIIEWIREEFTYMTLLEDQKGGFSLDPDVLNQDYGMIGQGAPIVVINPDSKASIDTISV